MTEDKEPEFDAPSMEEQERMVEAILFASAEPVTVAELASRMPMGSSPGEAVRGLRERYEGRGVELKKTGDAWVFRTASDLGFLMQRERVIKRRLSRAAVETLAIIAYHQPVTRAEIEDIRGHALSKGTVDQLLELEWVKIGQRRQTPGRPVTFVVTRDFLDHFGLESASDLPGLSELRSAGLLESRPPPGAENSGADEEGADDGPDELDLGGEESGSAGDEAGFDESEAGLDGDGDQAGLGEDRESPDEANDGLGETSSDEDEASLDGNEPDLDEGQARPDEAESDLVDGEADSDGDEAALGGNEASLDEDQVNSAEDEAGLEADGGEPAGDYDDSGDEGALGRPEKP